MRNAFRVDPGFRFDGVVTASFYPSLAGMNGAQATVFYKELAARVRSVPGVQSVGLAERLPLTFVIQISRCAPQGKDTSPREQWSYIDRSGAGPGYFQTMQIPILEGREFRETDTSSSPLVVIVNQALAKLFWPGQDAIGRKVRFGSEEKYAEVVGVARDGKYRTLGEQVRPFIYRPVQQQGNPDLTLLARVAGDPRPMFAALREGARQIDSKVPVMQIESLEDKISVSLLLPQAGASLFGLLGLLGLVLASVGLYGVIAYTTSHRMHEIGIRMTLGANPREILQLILRQGLILAAAGITVGLAGSVAMTRVLSVMLYGISATDTMTFIGISGFLLLVSLLASYIPARRAMRVDPMVALRYE
jgi:predicted permease